MRRFRGREKKTTREREVMGERGYGRKKCAGEKKEFSLRFPRDGSNFRRQEMRGERMREVEEKKEKERERGQTRKEESRRKIEEKEEEKKKRMGRRR